MKRIMLLITSFLLLIMLAGCRSSDNSNGKLPLTKENIQKVFSEQYNVGVDAIDEPTETDKGSIEITFGTKKNVNRKDAPKLIKDIRKKLHENFDIGSDNHIELYNYNKKWRSSSMMEIFI